VILTLLREGPESTYSVEKLLLRIYSKNSRPAEASRLLGRGGACDPLLRATWSLLTNAPTIRRVSYQLQRTHARIPGERNLEFFNRIDPLRKFAGSQSRRSTFEFTGLRRFLRRSGEMKGYAAFVCAPSSAHAIRLVAKSTNIILSDLPVMRIGRRCISVPYRTAENVLG
jgi:hypothetical protein